MQIPSLYEENAGNKRLTWKYFVAWIALSVYHSIVAYFFGFMIFNTNNAMLFSTPYTADLSCFGTFLIHNVVFIVTLKLCLIARCQTFIFIITILTSVAAFMTSTLVYNWFFMWDGRMLYAYNYLLSSITFWFSSFLICVTALLPDYVIIALKMFNIKMRPADTITHGWNRLFKDQRTIYPLNSHTPDINENESTYL